MPTTTRSRTTHSSDSRSVLELDPGLEGLELGIPSGLPGDDRSELLERAEIGAGQPRRAAPAADPPISRELVDEAVERVAGRRRSGKL